MQGYQREGAADVQRGGEVIKGKEFARSEGGKRDSDESAAKFGKVSVLLHGSNTGPIAAVQDHFGAAYRCGRITRSAFERNADGVPEMYLACEIVKKVPLGTIKNLLRGSRYEHHEIQQGQWYEVRGE